MSKREMTDSLERPGLLKDVKVVLVGPAKCGKTALIQRFVNGTFSDKYVPTGFEKYSTKRKSNDYTIEYSIWDTSGSGSYDTVRPLAYQDAQVFIVCFSVIDADSLEIAMNKWFPELKSHCPQTPIILCGCKADANITAEDGGCVNKEVISSEQAIAASQRAETVAYVETSSRLADPAVDEIFEIAAEAALGISRSTLHIPKTTTKKRKTYSVGSATLNKEYTTKTKPPTKPSIRSSTKNCCLM